jgi:hypothetical protein
MLEGFFLARKGKKFGNAVADILGMPRGLFHTAMEQGGCDAHLVKLANMREEGLDIEEVAYHSLTYLEKGLRTLESQWGYIPKIVSGLASVEKYKLYYKTNFPDKAEFI